MTAYVALNNVNVTTSAPAYALLANDTLYVAAGVSVVHSGGNVAVTGTGTSDTAIAGSLVSARGNVFNYSNADATHYLTVTSTGQLYAYSSAIQVSGGVLILTNNGSIAGSTGISLSTSNNASVNVNANIQNTGVITAPFYANSTGITLFSNTGLLSSDGDPRTIFSYYSAGGGLDVIMNSGKIAGSVFMGGGNDVYSGETGIVTGLIAGGQGADTITGGVAGDRIYGDDPPSFTVVTTGGDDVLSGGYGDDVIYGGYGADQFYGNQDADVLYGNQDNDWMHGGQGDDVLYGGQGNDTLNGGKGDDLLVGGLGDDLFIVSGAGFGHDIITDFRGSGANDILQLTTDIFGSFADLQAHATAVSNGTLLTDNTGDTLLLVGIAPSSLTAAMFVFSGS